MHSLKPIVYAYGIVKKGKKLDLQVSREGLEGLMAPGPLRLLPFGNIAALVSDLWLQEGQYLEEIMQDATVTQRLVLDHHAVLAVLVDQTTILPLRFGAVFSDDVSVISALSGRSVALTKAIGRIDGALEWGIKTFCDREMMGHHLSIVALDLNAHDETKTPSGEGSAFFMRKRLERLSLAKVENALEECLKQAETLLQPSCLEAAFVALQGSGVHRHAHEMVSNKSYLVAREHEAAFRQALDILKDLHGPLGLDYQLSGPWPAYSFSDQDFGKSPHAA